MGSCISPLLANIFMEHNEKEALSSFHELPRIWIRYVDDISCVIKCDVINSFLSHINSKCPSIEMEENGRLPFLDVEVFRNHDNILDTTIYHKPTHTNRYLQFDSHYPIHQKITITNSLYNRINTHITNPTHRKSHQRQVKETLSKIGFPAKYCAFHKPHFSKTLYTKGITEKIQ